MKISELQLKQANDLVLLCVGNWSNYFFLKPKGYNGIQNEELCDTDALLYQLIYDVLKTVHKPVKWPRILCIE